MLSGTERRRYVTGLSPSGRLLSASNSKSRFYGVPLVAWTPSTGATKYDVEWSRTSIPVAGGRPDADAGDLGGAPAHAGHVVLPRPREQPVAAREQEAQVVRPDAGPDRQADLQRRRRLGSVVRRLATNEGGFTLVELLIAMVIMAIGIAALVAGFSSGILAVNRAQLSTAGALADKQMETLPPGARSPRCRPRSQSATTPTGPDGHTYWMQVEGVWTCAVGTYSAGPPASCTGHTPASRPVKLVTITVRDGSATAKLLFTESATFDSSTG